MRLNKYQPRNYYMWSYFPHLPIKSVELIEAMPHGRKGAVIDMIDGYLVLGEARYSPDTIYSHPEFFKPIYK